MAAAQESQEITFAGNKPKQQQAERIFNLFRMRGMFMSDNAPIRITMDSLTAFIQEHDGKKPADTIALLEANAEVFAIDKVETRTYTPAPIAEIEEGADPEIEVEIAPPIETVTETTWVTTTRTGKIPLNIVLPNDHTFAERLMTPEPKIERPAEPVRERPRVDPSWATYTIPEGLELEADDDFVDDEIVETVAVQPVAVPPVDIAEVTVEPVIVFDDPVAPEPVAAEPVPAEPVVAEAVTEPVVAETVAEEAPIVAEPESVVAEVVAEAPVAAVRSGAGVVDVADYSDAAIAAAIQSELASDARAANFGTQWMSEDRVPRLSRGDLRRIKEYIEEQEQPLADATLVQDILNVRPNSADFPVLQFAMNYRLSKEHRDFEFVGTNDQRFWNTSRSPQLGTTRRKPNEIGTDFRYLVEQGIDVEARSIQSIDHVVTFYEFTLGLLPYDEELQRLLPRQLTDDQKSAVLTFEFPQAYTTYLVELRYPTPNRGGFLLGLDDFYAENLVPGAMISITATDNDGHYKVEYLSSENQTARLLELDDRRSPRYLFRPTTFSCTIDEKWQISEDRFPRLGSEKPLDDRIRRRPETVIEATFERIGLQDGNSWIATFDDLLAAANIERPFSAESLKTILSAHPSISGDGTDTFTYVTGT